MCRGRYLHRLSYREYQRKNCLIPAFLVQEFPIRQPAQGPCPHSWGDSAPCPLPYSWAHKSSSASRAEKLYVQLTHSLAIETSLKQSSTLQLGIFWYLFISFELLSHQNHSYKSILGSTQFSTEVQEENSHNTEFSLSSFHVRLFMDFRKQVPVFHPRFLLILMDSPVCSGTFLPDKRQGK